MFYCLLPGIVVDAKENGKIGVCLFHGFVAVLPLSLVNGLLRLPAWGEEALVKAAVLVLISCLMLWLGVRKLAAYNE
ncbi:hypothetical protein SOV_01360 [Sporomusa ovata DSM 2662]|uniref:Uncharacterized protein n=1 Tax=Sporomusa ovata TaxID=2378 RepID=A0A0U1L0S3_9FIRM|nr:hypothetical protein [Sporomusa ovata]EQB27820.1 hypothetical protein SOV_2c07290 [Sporomusa ovata DSM 2662]CQR72753.1 hypothetical protein SpAn4DRAFT_3213 [Sporomusa ovata]